MQIETMIYAYLAVCTAMILFNCVCIVVFRRQDRALARRSAELHRQITDEIGRIADGCGVSDTHLRWLGKKLRAVRHLMAFDQTLEELLHSQPDAVWRYLEAVRPVFTRLTAENHYRDAVQMAYFAYVIGKYRILSGTPAPPVVTCMMQLLEEPSLYCRENALQALYSTGDCGIVLQALRRVDESGRFHHAKLLTDGLLGFAGAHDQLMALLWQQFDGFSRTMQAVILDYIRFCGGRMPDAMLTLLADAGRDDELRFSCIRYFGKYPDSRAYPLLLSFVEHTHAQRWEYAAIAATALAAYPDARTVLALKRALGDANWYIRFNAAQSLERFGLTYLELADVMDSGDRYAREILQYRLDVRQTRQEEAERT